MPKCSRQNLIKVTKKNVLPLPKKSDSINKEENGTKVETVIHKSPKQTDLPS
jgi:hypothetical protein